MQTIIKIIKVFSASIFLSFSTITLAQNEVPYTVTKIWDSAPHNAFTDLIEFKGRFYCAFREGTGHIPEKDGSGDGEIRILVSDDGVTWKSSALLTKKGFDLRDAKLSVTPKGRLMVLMGGSIYDKGVMKSRAPQVSFSDKKGEKFSDPQPLVIDSDIRSDMDWLWRVTWYQKTGYGVIYQAKGSEWPVYLVKTTDGIHYQSVTKLEVTGKPNEATVDISQSGEMRIIMRREQNGDNNGWLGNSSAPYKDWKWTDLGIRLGGPHIITLPNGKTLIGSRTYETGANRTSLYGLDRQGKAILLLTFPSEGDTSYPGFVVKGDELWVSYYSGDEGRASIYLAKVKYSAIWEQTGQSVAKKITIDHFNVERPDSSHVRVTVAASGDNFRSFCFLLERLTPDATTPPGFYTTGSGHSFLNASRDEKRDANFPSDHPLNESKNPGEFVYTFNTTEWTQGRYLLVVQAHNRPSPGGYEVERRTVYIDVGPPIPVIVSNIPSAKHQLIYSQKDVYAAFPHLFPMEEGQLGLRFHTKSNDRHVDNSGGAKSMISNDEGQTWIETDMPLYLPSWRLADGSLTRADPQGWLYADISEESRLIAERRHPSRVDDTRIAWLGGICMQVSKDNGRSWEKFPLSMPEDLSGANGYHPIASFIHTSSGIRLNACYGKKYLLDDPEKLGLYEVFIIRSTDGGFTWDTRPMLPGGLPDPALGFDETALIETSGGKIIALSRSSHEDGLWQSESHDGGLSWSTPVKTPMNGYPAHVIRLKDGRLLCAYGMRRQAPQGIRAVISADEGKTWDIENEMIIRGDGAGNPSDMGYPILYQRADGSILVVYYLTTDGSYPSIWSTTFTL